MQVDLPLAVPRLEEIVQLSSPSLLADMDARAVLRNVRDLDTESARLPPGKRRWSHGLASPIPHPCEPGFHLLPEGDHRSFRLRYDPVEILLGVHFASSDDLLGFAFPLRR
jgi:hypothetical protein